MKRAALAVLFLAHAAHAGRTLYGWLPETDTVGDGAVEIGTTVYERDNLGPYHERTTALVWTPAIGLTPCLELAFPVEIATRTEDDAAPFSGVSRYGGELRWRIARGVLRDVPGLHPLARFAISRDVAVQSRGRGEVELAASYDLDRVQLAADVDGVLDLNFGHVHEEWHPSLGASVLVTGALRLGGELHAELSRDDTVASWAAIGPDVAWTRGRLWLAGALGIGIHAITVAPRLNLGVAW